MTKLEQAQSGEPTQRNERDWTIATWVIIGVLVARVIYLIWLTPWELVGDEAYYWEWSRHLDWCYYEKGPGQAYLIYPFVKLFGVHAWAVRLPVALLSAAAAWVLGRLAIALTGRERSGLLTVILFCLTPAFIANAQLCTQDGMIILVWSVLSAIGLRLVRNAEVGVSRLGEWLALAVWLGIGFLFKQSILLFLPTLVVYGWVRRRQIRWTGKLFGQMVVAGVVAGLFATPMVVWNARHGWPTLAHTLGHLGAGGDQDSSGGSRFSPSWFLSLLGAQIGALGPAVVALMIIAGRGALRGREDRRYADRLWLLCCALPSVAFFFLLSLTKPVLGSWPFPSYVTLLVLAGDWLCESWHRYWWRLAVGYGVGAALLLGFPTWLTRLPLPKKTTAAILEKMTGHRAHAQALDAARQSLVAVRGRQPIFIARYYMTAALDAFYLPDHPTVFCAGTQFGKRSTAYDFWAGTDLFDPALHGRDAALDGHGPRPWGGAFYFSQVEGLPGGVIFLGREYGGVIPRDKRPPVK
jgi:4-amino-4-deoxy-L-arabinose transferase-like glycosyltransferase